MAKLLLVEDDNNLREIYEARLQAEGYTIVSAQDGEEALVVAKAEKPDLVISDVMMPKISGFEMLDILRNTEELKSVKVIMLTALGQSDDQQRADKLGADRYMVKSQVTLEDIVKVTHELLGDQAGQDAAAAPAATAPATAPETPAPTSAPATAATQPAAAPATAPEPAAAPAPEPAATPAPAPKAAAPAEAKPAEAPAAPAPEPAKPADAKTTSKEEADIEAKIEDFVAGASSEPTGPGGTPPPAPADKGTQTAAPAPDPSASSDDKLMADAVDTLVASTGDDKSAKTSIPVTVTPDPQPEPAPAKPEAEPAASPKDDAGKDDDKDDTADGSVGGVKKIIKPLDTKPKKDINQLLAEEEAKEQGAVVAETGLPEASTTDDDKPAGAPMVSPSEAAAAEEKPSEPDPGSIAL